MGSLVFSELQMALLFSSELSLESLETYQKGKESLNYLINQFLNSRIMKRIYFYSFFSPQGSGTRTRTLNRIMVSRAEIDMNEIKGYYKAKYGVSLCQAILVGYFCFYLWLTWV